MERKEKRVILFVINGLGGGGSQRNVSLIANHFSECGHEVHIAVLLDPCEHFYDLNERINIHYFVKGSRSLKSYLYWIKCIKKTIKHYNVNLVLAIGYRFGLLCSFCIKRKVSLIIRGTITRKISRKDKILFYLKHRRIKTIVSQTNSQKKMYPRCVSKKLVTIPNPFEIFETNLNKDGFESKRFICVGRLFLEQKRQDYIINALTPFFVRHPDYFLEFYGEPQIDDDGSTLANLKTLISQNNLTKNVRIFPPKKNIWDICVPSIAFLCASKFEGMPNALIEAMLRGIVPVSTKWDGCEEIINNKENGLIVDGQNDFCDKLEEIIQDKKRYTELSNNAYSQFKDKYSKNKIFEEWNKLL